MDDSNSFADILTAFENGDISKAENLLKQARMKTPNDLRLAYIAGEIALSRDEYFLAMKEFRSARKEFPESPEVLGGLCEAASACGEYQEAFEAGYEGLSLGQLTPGQVACLGSSMALLGEVEAGKSLLQAQTEEFPDGGEAWTALGLILIADGDADGAQNCFERAVDIDNEDYKAQAGIGQLKMQNKEFGEASEHFATSLKGKPEFLPAREGLIESLWQLNDFENCLNVSECLLDDAPLNRTATLRKGLSLFALKKDKLAEEHLREALSQDPENTDVAVHLGGYLENEGRHAEALGFYEHAMKHCTHADTKLRLQKTLDQRRARFRDS